MTTAPEPDRAAEVEARVRDVAAIVHRVRGCEWIPWEPTDKQWQFLTDPHFEVMFGGSVGPGKSAALLMDALAYANEPGYNALMLRRTFPELSGPDGLISEAKSWLGGTSAYGFDGGKRWRFPSGATLTFGHMETDDHAHSYGSSQFSRIYYDELTTFTQFQYTFMFSRVRRPKRRSNVPLGVRSATNPIGRGLKWVRSRFIDTYDPDRRFIPALATDNPHLDTEAYELSLSMLDPITKARLQHGRWDVSAAGNFFTTDAVAYLSPFDLSYLTAAQNPTLRVRAWDLAATEGGGDYTAGVLVAYDRVTRRWRVEDVVRGQWGPDEVEARVRAAALADPPHTRYLIEQEPGSSGKMAARDVVRRVLEGFDAIARPSTGAKAERARLPASIMARGDMDVVMGAWVPDFRDELVAFAEDPKASGEHDDQVDALGAACHELRRLLGTESVADTSAVDTFRRMAVVTSDAARSQGPVRQGIPGLHPPSSSPFGPGGSFRRR